MYRGFNVWVFLFLFSFFNVKTIHVVDKRMPSAWRVRIDISTSIQLGRVLSSRDIASIRPHSSLFIEAHFAYTEYPAEMNEKVSRLNRRKTRIVFARHVASTEKCAGARFFFFPLVL